MPSPEDRVPPRTDLCLINYNGSRYLPDSLARIRELREQFGRIVVVDDASTDDSVAVIRELLPEARLVRLPRNRGPGAARNTGYSELEGDRILFVDNDVTLGPDVLTELSSALDRRPEAVMAMPRIVSFHDPGRIEYDGGDAHVSGLVALRSAGRRSGAMHGEPTSTVGSLISCCFLLDRSRWGEEPLFDERLRIYLEDHELGLRARMRGQELVIAPDAVCLHGAGTPGISIRETGRHMPVRVRNTILNRWQVILKLYQTRTLIVLGPYLMLFELYQIGGCLTVGWRREWMGAFRELLAASGDLRRRRRAFQATRRLPDTAVLSDGPHPFNPALAGRPVVRSLLGTLDAAARINWALARALDVGARPFASLPSPREGEPPKASGSGATHGSGLDGS